MDGNGHGEGVGGGPPDPQALARAALRRAEDTERSALAAEQTLADGDQGVADIDQTAADLDQTGSERDDSDALRDQRASDQDQVSADGQRPEVDSGPLLDAWEATRAAREATRVDRLATHAARAVTARARLTTAAERDSTATLRDEAARRRDERSSDREWSIAGSDVPRWRRRSSCCAPRAQRPGLVPRPRASRRQPTANVPPRTAPHSPPNGSAWSATCAAPTSMRSTGALRREIGWLTLGHELARARRGDGRLVVAYVDVDDMKGVNDRGGHAAGDHVLQRLVWEMRGNLRPYDPVIRAGGDEFVCGWRASTWTDARRRFSLIAWNVRQELRVGISVGLATLAATDSVDDLVGRADASLLEARQGR